MGSERPFKQGKQAGGSLFVLAYLYLCSIKKNAFSRAIRFYIIYIIRHLCKASPFSELRLINRSIPYSPYSLTLNIPRILLELLYPSSALLMNWVPNVRLNRSLTRRSP